MRWFRSQARWTAYLALLALTCQLALALDHVHHTDVDGQPRTERTIQAAAMPSLSDRQHADAAPASDEPRGHQDGYCTVCAIVGLINASQIADSAALPLPSGGDYVRLFCSIETRPLDLRFVLSQARAPPLA